MSKFLQRTLFLFSFLLSAYWGVGQDLSLSASMVSADTFVGGTIRFRVVLYNDAHQSETGVTVSLPIPEGTTYLSDNNSVGTYDFMGGVWDIGDVDAATDSVVIELELLIDRQGVISLVTEITAMGDTDLDSTPNNNDVTEDDWSGACASIPMIFTCTGTINVLASAPSGYANYQWYKDSIAISGETNSTYTITTEGSYYFTANVGTLNCPAQLCCPIKVMRDVCMQLGNKVYSDLNNNGTLDIGENGIDSIVVELWRLGVDFTPFTSDDELVKTDTTSGGGVYLFDGLEADLYYVRLTGVGIPAGFVSSTGDGIYDFDTSGTAEPGNFDDTVDNDDNGTQNGVTVTSDVVMLNIGTEPIDEDGDANTNLSIDFGLYRPTCQAPDISATVPPSVCAPATVNLGSVMVTDANNITAATMSYFATAQDAADSTNFLTNLEISSSGRYWIRKTADVGGCFDTVSVFITINARPNIADSTVSVCTGSVINLTNYIASYASYTNPTWLEGTTLVTDPTAVSPTDTTTYMLIAESAQGCIDSADVLVNVSSQINAGTDTTLVCVLGVSPSTYDLGVVGTWRVLTQPIGGSAIVNSSGVASNIARAGVYEFELANGACTDTVLVTVPTCTTCQAPDISATAPPSVCAPATVNLGSVMVTDANNITAATMSYFATAQDAADSTNFLTNLEISSSGRYWIRKTADVGGCFDTVSVFITINAPLHIADSAVSVCTGYAIDLTSYIPSYASLRNPVWLAGAVSVDTPNAIFPTISTAYTFIAENAGGCADTANISITVNTKPNAGADRNLTCSGSTTPSTTDFMLAGNWSVLSQPLGANATIDANGNATDLTVEGTYTFEVELNGCTDTVNVEVSDCFFTFDIGDMVWNDANNNGIKDSAETGIANIEVLLLSAGIDGLPNTSDDLEMMFAYTDTLGKYRFINLPEDNYFVRLTGIGIPSGYVSSTGDGASDTDESGSFEPSTEGDTNNRDHGTKNGSFIESGIITLSLWGEPTNDGDTSSLSNLTIDFGLYQPSQVSASTCNNTGLTFTTATNCSTLETTFTPSIATFAAYAWSFGDGDTASQVSPRHTYLATGSYGVQVIVTDTAGCRDTIFRLISVQRNSTNPVLVGVPADTTFDCAATTPTAPTVTAVGATVRMTENRIAGTCVGSHQIVRTWTATDSCGNVATASQTISFIDNTPPTFSSVASVVTLNCGTTIPSNLTPTIIDNCDPAPRLKLAEMRDTLSPCNIVLTRLFIANDSCGNASQFRQIINIVDTTAPTITPTFPALVGYRSGDTMTIDCGAMRIFSMDDVVIADNCATGIIRSRESIPSRSDTAIVASFVDIGVRLGNCRTNGYKMIMQCAWRTVDPCGNRSEFVIYFKVIDSVAPVLTGIPADTTVASLNDIPTVPTVTARDNCSGASTVVFAQSEAVPSGTNCGLIVTRTWTSSDTCGNTRIATQRITIGDSLRITANTTAETCTRNNGTISMSPTTLTYNWGSGVIGASRTGLRAGTYAVTATAAGGCQRIMNVTVPDSCICPSFITQTTLVKVLTNCSDTAQVCLEIPSTELATYTITDNGAAYRNGFGTCATGATIRMTAGDHIFVFTRPDGCRDTLEVKAVCTPDSTLRRTLDIGLRDTVCLTASGLGLTGTITSITNECAAGNNTTVTLNSTTNCVITEGVALGVDTACIRVTTSTGRTARVNIITTVVLNPLCTRDIVSPDSIFVSDSCFNDSVRVCINVPYFTIFDYQLYLDGIRYTGRLEGCRFDTSYAYNYFTIPGRGTSGPYTLDYWELGGTTHTIASFSNMQTLVDSMNIWDAGGNWELDATGLTISRFGSYRAYGRMKITAQNNGAFAILDINNNITPQATYLYMQSGTHQLIFLDQNRCVDTMFIAASCTAPRRIQNSIVEGKRDTVCLDTRHLAGTNFTITNPCIPAGSAITYTVIPNTACVVFFGRYEGIDSTCFVVRDEFGFTQTVYLVTQVMPLSAKKPVAKDDLLTSIRNKPIEITVTKNDSLYSSRFTMSVIDQPKNGQYVLDAFNGKVIYTPDNDFCGSQPDVFSYAVCTAGGCDTAKVFITISCDAIKIFNAFSPNADGMNDYFVIEGLEKFPNNRVRIFNRWGTEIMRTENYKNDWNGNWNGSELPDGTYFYLVEDGEGHTFTGYVQIQR